MPVRHRTDLRSLNWRQFVLAMALAMALAPDRPAHAADICVQFEITDVKDDKSRFSHDANELDSVKRMLAPKLQYIREQLSTVFSERALTVDFQCRGGNTARIATANGTVTAIPRIGHRFRGNFTPGARWHDRLTPNWQLDFLIENEECEISSELIAVSNALLDYRVKQARNPKDIPQALLRSLGGYVNNFCGGMNSTSYRQLKRRLELLGFTPDPPVRRANSR